MIKESVIIDGRAVADQLLFELQEKIATYKARHNAQARLAIILIGDDPASKLYVSNKIRMAEKIGILISLHHFDADISEHRLLGVINKLNEDSSVHGIIVQLPLPKHISIDKVVGAIDARKDVDGFNPVNVGLLYNGFHNPGLIPCTAQGCVKLIKMCEPNLAGKNVVIVGRSNIVGRPVAALLLRENCTVTICHSRTQNLSSITLSADIVVAAIGKARFLTNEYFNNNAIVIDVGINKVNTDGKMQLVGDVDFESVRDKVKYITPVPGGVGPMTIAYLLINTFDAMLMIKQMK